MMDMMCEDEMAIFVLDYVTAIQIKRAEEFVRCGVDILFLGDDIGMQESILMSEELYCKWIKPRQKAVIDAAKKINPDILIKYHSCGYIIPFIPHLIEIGVDILNPIQPECMNFEDIHNKYKDRLSFWGVIGTQSTMPYGSVDEVKEITTKALDIAGDHGGLIACPTHLLEPDVPWKNIVAYAQAISEYK